MTQTAALVESMRYASISRLRRCRSNRGRDTAPATSTVMFDSIKMTIPTT